MKIILKQFFRTILKKFPLMIALLFSLAITVTTASIGSFMISAISTSNSKINDDGNSSDIIFDNIKQNVNVNFNGEWNRDSPKKMITTINMNGVDPKQEELIVLPVNTSDYTRLINSGPETLPSWDQTSANNLNYLASEPNTLGTKFISPAALFLFMIDSVLGYHLSLRPAPIDGIAQPINVFLDPRSLIFEGSSIIGFYKDFEFQNELTIPQSTMQIYENINLFNPLSLTNQNIRRSGLHLNSLSKVDFLQEDRSWTDGFKEEKILNTYFERLPNISSPTPDLQPPLGTGIPYIERTPSALTINLKLGNEGTIEEQEDPLTRLYLTNLSPEERNKILNREILVTPFQVDGESIDIPTDPAELQLFENNLNRLIINLEEDAKNDLKQNVSNYAVTLARDSINGLDWTQTQSIQATQDSTTYLFTSREINDINKIVIESGRELFKNEQNTKDLEIIESVIGNNATFASQKRQIEILANSDMTVFDTNENMPGNPMYPGTNVIRTVKERRLLTDILKDTLEAFNKVDNNITLNSLDPNLTNNMNEYEIYSLINKNKIDAITNMPIWLEFSATILRFNNNSTYSTSLNPRITFQADRGFNPIDSSISSISKLNFDNYGVIVSSSHFDARKLKVVSEQQLSEIHKSIENSKNESIALRQDFNFDIATKREIDKLPNEYKISINGQSFFINGSGDAPDFKSPIIDLTKPLPNSKNEGIVYVNISQFSVINLGSRGNFEEKTINIKSKNNSIFGISSLISDINKKLDFEFQKVGSKNVFNVYRNNDFINFTNASTFRWYYFDLLNLIISISVIVFSLILLALVIYILSMIIKFIFDSLSFSIAIARANGMPRRKIILALSIIIIGFGSLFVALAFIISYFITPLFFGILSGFWFVPFGLSIFPWWGIFVVVAVVTFVVGTIISILTLSTMNTPILMTLSGNEIIKTNKLSKIVRSNKIKISSLSKLRISMMSTKSLKISMISILMGLSFGVSVTTFSLSDKVMNAKDNNQNTKQYAFAFDYLTPQYQTGLIKTLSYNQLGEISIERSIDTILSPPIPGAADPYYDLVYDANGNYKENPLLAKRIIANNNAVPTNSLPDTRLLRRNNGELRTYENIVLPSGETAAEFRNFSTEFLFNVVISAEILDTDIGTLLGVQIGNLWDQVSARFPSDIRLRLESNIQIYRNNVLKKYPWYSQFLIKENPLDINSPPAFPLEINADVIFDKTALRFTDKYLIALGIFLGDQELNHENTMINFNLTANDNVDDEPYTYVLGTNNQNNKDIKLVGIKNNSNYVNLKSSSGKQLNYLISSNSNKVIVNGGAAFANSWSVGDRINITVKNDYYNDIKNIVGDISNTNFKNKIISLEIVGISTDSIGETFWINQDYANSLINLQFSDYVFDFDNNPIFPKPTGGSYVQREDFKPIINTNTGDIIAPSQFNGIFSRNEIPLISSVSIPMTSRIGIYPVFFDIQTLGDLASLFENYNQWLELYSPQLNPATQEIYEAAGVTTRDEFINYLRSSFNTPDIFLNYLEDYFQNSTYSPSIISLDGVAVSDQIFNLTSTSSEIASIAIMISFIPLLIITVMVSIMSLADDFRKSMSIMRVLGINKRNIIGSIMLIYLPIIIIGVLLGLLFSFILNIIFQALFFNILSVFLSTSINGLIYGLSIVVMAGLISISVLITTIILMREKLENSIKF